QVLLFLEEPEQQPVYPLVGLPVDVTEIVAARVLPVVGELDPASLLGRPPVGAVPPGELAARDDLKVFQLLEEFVLETERHDAQGVTGRCPSEVPRRSCRC